MAMTLAMANAGDQQGRAAETERPGEGALAVARTVRLIADRGRPFQDQERRQKRW
jgi:hypothetical protein